MFEYKILHLKRMQKKKTRDIVGKKNKVEIETYTETETFEDFMPEQRILLMT